MTAKKSTTEKKPLAAARRRPEAPKDEEVVPGTVEMGRAAGRALKKNSEKIAESLANNSMKGHVQSARLLLELAEAAEKLAREAGGHRAPSQALRLAEEPEWESSPVDAPANSSDRDAKETPATPVLLHATRESAKRNDRARDAACSGEK